MRYIPQYTLGVKSKLNVTDTPWLITMMIMAINNENEISTVRPTQSNGVWPSSGSRLSATIIELAHQLIYPIGGKYHRRKETERQQAHILLFYHILNSGLEGR